MCDKNIAGKQAIPMKKIMIDPKYEAAFYNACKRGIYKELERRKLITDTQLNQLLRHLE